jgi:hypothetical protein
MVGSVLIPGGMWLCGERGEDGGMGYHSIIILTNSSEEVT